MAVPDPRAGETKTWSRIWEVLEVERVAALGREPRGRGSRAARCREGGPIRNTRSRSGRRGGPDAPSGRPSGGVLRRRGSPRLREPPRGRRRPGRLRRAEGGRRRTWTRGGSRRRRGACPGREARPRQRPADPFPIGRRERGRPGRDPPRAEREVELLPEPFRLRGVERARFALLRERDARRVQEEGDADVPAGAGPSSRPSTGSIPGRPCSAGLPRPRCRRRARRASFATSRPRLPRRPGRCRPGPPRARRRRGLPTRGRSPPRSALEPLGGAGDGEVSTSGRTRSSRWRRSPRAVAEASAAVAVRFQGEGASGQNR